MGAALAQESDYANPLDRVERLAERRDWPVDRTNDHEVNMRVASAWNDLFLSLNWHDDLESLHLACSYDIKVPDKHHAEVTRLLALVNARLHAGHFDLWADGSVIYRHSLTLAGGAIANDAQCEAMIRTGLSACEVYFPALQFVVWAGKTAEDAMAGALFDTMGEA
jgi:hypothetical protein